MKITIDSIPSNGVEVQAGLDQAWARGAATLAAGAAPDTLEVQLRVRRADPILTADGHIETTWRAVCDRCLRDIRITLTGAVDLRYAVAAPHAEVETELSSEDLDIGWFDGLALDLAQVVSEQLALWGADRYRCDDQSVARIPDESAPCSPPQYDAGPELKRASPFAGLAKLVLPE